MDEKRYIAALIKHRDEHAVDGVARSGINAPEMAASRLGYLTGYHNGLAMAEQILTNMLKEDKEKDI